MAQAERESLAASCWDKPNRRSPRNLLEAADIYGCSPAALQLRAMNIIYETTKERRATDRAMPTAMVDSMNPGLVGLAAAHGLAAKRRLTAKSSRGAKRGALLHAPQLVRLRQAAREAAVSARLPRQSDNSLALMLCSRPAESFQVSPALSSKNSANVTKSRWNTFAAAHRGAPSPAPGRAGTAPSCGWCRSRRRYRPPPS